MTTIPPPTQVLVQTNRKAVPVWYDFFRTIQSTNDPGFLTLEQFGGSGNNTTDNGPAWKSACNQITSQGYGYIVLQPGKTYYINVSGLGNQAHFSDITGASGTGIIGNGATIRADATYTGAIANYLLFFNGCKFITLRDFSVTAFAELPDNTTAFRGLSCFVFFNNGSLGCRYIEAKNLKITGGRHLLWASTASTASGSESRHFDIANVEADTTHYPIQFYGGQQINIRNYKTRLPNRSLFLENVKHMWVDLYSTGHADDDVLVVCWNDPTQFPDNILENLHVKYACNETANVGAAVAFVWRTNTTGAVMRNVTVDYNVNAANTTLYVLAYMDRQTLAQAQDNGPARGHVADSFRISGVGDNFPNGQPLTLFENFPAGEIVTTFRLEDFSISSVYSLVKWDTTSLLGMHDVDSVYLNGGDIQLTGTAAGTINLKSFKSNDNLVLSASFAKLVASAGVYVRTAL